jgi:hypothetical protein
MMPSHLTAVLARSAYSYDLRSGESAGLRSAPFRTQRSVLLTRDELTVRFPTFLTPTQPD